MYSVTAYQTPASHQAQACVVVALGAGPPGALLPSMEAGTLDVLGPPACPRPVSSQRGLSGEERSQKGVTCGAREFCAGTAGPERRASSWRTVLPGGCAELLEGFIQPDEELSRSKRQASCGEVGPRQGVKVCLGTMPCSPPFLMWPFLTHPAQGCFALLFCAPRPRPHFRSSHAWRANVAVGRDLSSS